MGKVNVYLPDDLEREVREAAIPLSSVCQSALRTAVEQVRMMRHAGDLGDARDVVELTPRLTEILATHPRTVHDLFGAIVIHGQNLGARVLVDLGVELPPPAKPRRRTKAAGDPAGDDVREMLVTAYLVALELRHGYVGTEHVVIAMAREGAPTAELFAALGLDERAVRARVERLLANPWRVDAPGQASPTPEALDRLEAELHRLHGDLARLRSSTRGSSSRRSST
ncbi:MAG TPA: Clp protease N-terminal domain-containing protein [Acidimicrobiales bacterium]|nr:Clp protease N-terminal domain-containing protein [Acidimicrobiales bacterium]